MRIRCLSGQKRAANLTAVTVLLLAGPEEPSTNYLKDKLNLSISQQMNLSRSKS